MNMNLSKALELNIAITELHVKEVCKCSSYHHLFFHSCRSLSDVCTASAVIMIVKHTLWLLLIVG